VHSRPHKPCKNNRQEASTNISEDDDDKLGICSWSVYIYKSTIELISNSISTLPLILISLLVSAQNLPDGRYIDWEKDYIVKDGQLISCTGAGKNDSSGNETRAS